VAGFIGSICDLLPLPPLVTKDQVRMLKTDSVVSDGAEGFAALGVTPTPITEELPTYLSRFVKA
jgi:NADH dehydrogenase